MEQSTSIDSGILRMKDLALSLAQRDGHFSLVAPESREQEVPSGELRQQCDAMCRFGVDRTVLLKIAKARSLPV